MGVARVAAVLLPVALVVARGLAAQAATEHERAPAAVRWGKWGAAALFAGFTAHGVVVHDRANADFEALIRWCQGGGGSCVLAPGGAYADTRAEALYQSSISGDRAARGWLLAGQAALIGAVTLFVLELRYSHGPENIPFVPQLEVTPGTAGTRIGLRIPLRR